VATVTVKVKTPPEVNAGPDRVVYQNTPVLWTPAALTTTAWYDASDTTTISHTSGAVSQWREKKNNGRNLAQATSTAQPRTGTRTINGLNAIDFDGSNDALTGATNHTDAITIFGVVQVDSGTGTDANRCWFSAPQVNWTDYQMMAPANADTLGSYLGSSTVSLPAARNTAHIHAAYSWIPGGAGGGVRVNGGTPTALTALAGGMPRIATELAVGRQKNTSGRFHDGLIGEIIVINSRLTESDPDFLKIEGYLAHKWRLLDKLPADHPYKSEHPLIGMSALVELNGSASDANGDPLTTTWTVTEGVATVANPTSLVTNSSILTSGFYTFRLTANDGTFQVHDDVRIEVRALDTNNAAPVAQAQSVRVARNSANNAIALTAIDAENDALSYAIKTYPTKGTLSGTPPNLTYTPNTSFSGSDSFTFTASDFQQPSQTATVSITVNSLPVVDAGPNQTVVLQEVPWTPVQMAIAPTLWYDADDASTIVHSSGSVSQWSDKSASAKHLTQATSDARPKTGTRTINGLNVIEFDGSNDVLLGASNRTDDITIFGVVQVDSGSGTDGNRSWLSAPGGNNPDFWMPAPANADSLSAYILDTTGSGSSGSRPAARNTAHLQAAYSWVPNGDAGGLRVNGGATVSLAAKATGLQKLATELAIGRQKSTSGRFHDGLIGEIIIINSRLSETDDDFLRIEGYLAHKWGLTAKLPEGHPYKSAMPVFVTATLDGTAYDPDADPFTTNWSVASTVPANLPSVTIANTSAVDTTATFTHAGQYTLRLTATEPGGETVSDEVTITVRQGGAPLAYAGEDQTVFDSNNDGSENVTLDGSGSSAPFGSTITSHVWETGGTQIATGATPTVSLPVGIHEITLTVTDGDGVSASDIVTITVLRFNNAPIVHAGPNQTVSISGDAPVPWTPAKLTTAAWYDGADASTLTTVGGAVSQWNDKSGNGRHVSQAVANQQPSYSNNAVVFDGVDDLLKRNTAFIYANGSADVYIVGAFDGGNFDKRLFAESNSADNNPWYSIFQGRREIDATMTSAYIRDSSNTIRLSNASILSASGALDLSTRKLYQARDTGSSVVHRVGGGSTVSLSYTRGATTLDRFGLGGFPERPTLPTGGSFMRADLNELIVVPSLLSDSDRQKVEGYLAHKWGMTASLPSAHPYKSAAPTEDSGPTATATATLAGSASDADNDPLTTTWSVISTPAGGSATFDYASAPDTTATFTALGEYVLRLTASDGLVSAYDEVTITVTDGTTGLDAFNDWTTAGGGGGVTFTGDSNSDGLADGMAWLLGSQNPTHRSNELLPQQTAEPDGDLRLTFKMLNSSQRGTAVLRLEHSRDLGVTDPWSENVITIPDSSSTVDGVEFTITPIDTDRNQVTATLPAAAANGTGKLFVRLSGVLSP
jgi:hypothetical protein